MLLLLQLLLLLLCILSGVVQHWWLAWSVIAAAASLLLIICARVYLCVCVLLWWLPHLEDRRERLLEFQSGFPFFFGRVFSGILAPRDLKLRD
jgi:hypothetical protein